MAILSWLFGIDTRDHEFRIYRRYVELHIERAELLSRFFDPDSHRKPEAVNGKPTELEDHAKQRVYAGVGAMAHAHVQTRTRV